MLDNYLLFAILSSASCLSCSISLVYQHCLVPGLYLRGLLLHARPDLDFAV